MKIQRKIQLIAVLPVVIAGLCLAGILLLGKSNVQSTIQNGTQMAEEAVLETAKNSTAVIVKDVWRMCRAQMDAIQKKVNADLNVARDELTGKGAINLANEKVQWQAINQYDKTPVEIELPKIMVGDTWLGQNADMGVNSPVVDKVQRMVGGTCTIFQRMNQAGDMLRVSTNVEKLDGSRAIGTYIPAVNPDGKPNPVVSTIMKGETFRGRAYVVNAWYITAYEPILNADDEIIGVLYVGVKQENVDSLRKGIMDINVGKTGYVFVLGASGDQKGHYIISKDGERDGEDILEAKDSDGNYFVKDIVRKATALDTENAETLPVDFLRYPWKNEGESEARMKITAVTYFEPWDWVIGAGAYESDYAKVQEEMNKSYESISHSFSGVIRTSLTIIIALAVLGIIVATLIARRIARPLVRTADTLQDISEGEGDLTARLDVKSDDEIGDVARHFNQFVKKLQTIIAEVATNTATLASTSEELSSNAGEMTSSAENMSNQTSSAASAVEQLSSNLTNISAGAEETSTTVNTVATAVEEMSSSLAEVAKNCAEGAQLSGDADTKARNAGESMNALNVSADEIGKVIEAISDIADQTNLLALNATIEAASAGEAGKGFAVVANEVKELAKQTATATEEIGRLISEMQNKTGDAVHATEAISETITRLNNTVQTIASAVEEQSATTNEIAQNVGNASTATSDISRNIAEASQGSAEISENIQGVNNAAEVVKSGASQTNTGSEELARMAARLKELVGQFKTS